MKQTVQVVTNNGPYLYEDVQEVTIDHGAVIVRKERSAHTFPLQAVVVVHAVVVDE